MPKIVLFQGDSITDCARKREDPLSLGGGYANLAAAEMGYKYPGEFIFYNRGISGNRVPDVYARIVRDIIKIKPDYLSILVGINDVWHQFLCNGTGLKRYEKVYNMLLDEIREELPQTKIFIMEPYVEFGSATMDTEAEPNRWDIFRIETAEIAAAARRVAEGHGLKFVTLQDKFDAACEKQPVEYWLKDGVHPTTAGHELIAREWVKVFEEIK